MGLVLGIDIGGTFTDLVLFDEETRSLCGHKELTDTSDPNKSVVRGVNTVLKMSARQAGDITRVVHATTLFTNALIERRGAQVGLITTQGFRDVTEIARELKYELYDLFIQMPQPLCPRERRFEAAERVGADGALLKSVDETALLAAVDQALAIGSESIAVCFVNAFVNPANELRAEEIILHRHPELSVSLSHRAANEIREYERFSTAITNAYIQPLAERYLRNFGHELATAGIAAPIYVMLSNGGLTTLKKAMAAPIHLLESGPAAGALAAAYFARLVGVEDIMALDLGGTTAKLCTIEKGAPLVTHRFEAAREKRFVPDSGLPLRSPTVDLLEIGAGGGSIARRDNLGLLAVGPQSAASDPGPACYGLGGTAPTVTDANLRLGYLDPAYFAGGGLKLDSLAADAALARLGQDLDLAPLDAAGGIYDLANENMAGAARVHAAERGRDPSSLALVVTGGGGPLHGVAVARKLGIRMLICPPGAGVASAIGLVLAPARIDRVTFVSASLTAETVAILEKKFHTLEEEARREVEAMGLTAGSAQFSRFADMRYTGQGFDLFVRLPAGPYDESSCASLRAAFEQEYRAVFGRIVDWGAIELVNARVTAISAFVDGNAPLRFPPPLRDRLPPTTERDMRLPGSEATHRVVPLRWDAIDVGQSIDGPGLLQQRGTTLVLGPGDKCDLSDSGVMVVSVAAAKGVGYDASEMGNVGLQVLWRRLIGIVDEASASLARASFSTVVRESGDYSIVITDAQGQLLAQGTQCIPVFIGSLPQTVKHFIREIGVENIQEGDILITNDPWMGTGHLFDICLAMPIFQKGQLVAFAASTAHAADIGGRSGAQKVPDVYEEGFQILPMKLAERGKLDQTLIRLLGKNVRSSDQVLGDLFGQMSALDLVKRRLLSVMEEWQLEGLEAFGEATFTRTDEAMRRALARLPQGCYVARQNTDGMTEPVELKAAVSVAKDRVVVDYAGSSKQIPAALNVAYCYTYAMTVYALKCILDPDSPNNEGSFRAIEVVAPKGSILNHDYPYSGANRALVGHYLPGLVLEAVSAVVPDRVIAGVGSPIWSFLMRGTDTKGRRVVLKCFFNGGMGASAERDGLNATSWPSNIAGAPVEVIEQLAPVRVNFKRLRDGSGGIGRHRGGLGSESEFEVVADGTFTIGFNAERTNHAAHGLFGGQAGALGEVRINDKLIDIRDTHTLLLGDRILIRTPGGGGYGPRKERRSAFTDRDSLRGYD
jgi:5-oxoprolinase (ATP-hydrolysing)